MNSTHFHRRAAAAAATLVAAVAFGAGLVACGGDSPEKLIASAKTYLEKKDPRTATIQLKTALQTVPDSGEARFLLGTALYAAGDPASAAVEWRKAADLKYPAELVVPRLASALAASGQGRKAVDDFTAVVLAKPAAQAELKTTLAMIQAGLGNKAQAEHELQAAFAADPNSDPAWLLGARFKALEGDQTAAIDRVETVLKRSPENDDAWLLKGELLWRIKADGPGAMEAFRKSLALRSDSLAAHVGMMSVLLGTQQLDAATAQLAEMKKVLPRHPMSGMFEASIALQRRDFPAARKLAEQVLLSSPNDMRVLYVAGVAQLMTGGLLQAQKSLSKALQTAPDSEMVRRMLAQTELKLGQPVKALQVMQPLLEAADPSADVLGLAAQANMLSGDNVKAQQYFNAAAKRNPEDVRSRTAFALGRLGEGDGSAALGQLQDIAASDKGSLADLGLVYALMERRNYDDALKAIDALAKKKPRDPLASHLRGTVLIEKKDIAAARSSFEAALALDPTYFTSVARLAALDLADNKPEAARQRFERLLAVDPSNLSAQMALIDLKARAGASNDEITESIRQAIKSNPGEVAPRVRLVQHQLRIGDLKSAVTSAQSGVAALPDNPQLIDVLGTAQLAAGEQVQASTSFGKLASLQPNSPVPYLRLADVEAAARRPDAALQNLRRALALAPNSLPLQVRLAQQLIVTGKQPEALTLARALQKASPLEPVGLLLEGDAEGSRRNWDRAATAYAAAQAMRPSTAAAVKLHSVLLDAKRRPEADALAQRWLAAAPNDIAFTAYLAEAALLGREYATAETHYLQVLKLQPQQVQAMNNVAWLMVEQNKPGALAYAEKANQLKPDQPPFMDTLATVLGAEKQLDKAVALQKRVVQLQPDNPNYRLHLATLYLQAGDKAAARVELSQLAKLGVAFREQAEVGRLMKTL